MKVKLTNMLFYNGCRYRAGTVVDLPKEVVPKSAEVLEGKPLPKPRKAAEKSELRSVYRGNPKRPEAARWRLMHGKTVLEEFVDKSACEVARIDLEQNPETLQERLAEVLGDAVS